MIAVIFEVEPAEGRKDEYLDIASEMRPMLNQVDGFISVERFQSLGAAIAGVTLINWPARQKARINTR